MTTSHHSWAFLLAAVMGSACLPGVFLAEGGDDSGSVDSFCAGDDGTFVGNVTAGNDFDLAPLQGCRTIEGRLVLQGVQGTSALADLERVIGSLAIEGNNALTIIDLPVLRLVNESFTIGANDALTAVDLPRLTTVGGALSISTNGALTSISLPALTGQGTIDIQLNGALTTCIGPLIVEVGDCVQP